MSISTRKRSSSGNTARSRPFDVGDRVRFAHQAKDGPDRVVTSVLEIDDEQFLEIEGFTGQFNASVVVPAPGDA